MKQVQANCLLWIMAIPVLEIHTRFEIVLSKNQHTQRRSLNFENGVVGMCKKVTKFDIQSQFSTSKIIEMFHKFYVPDIFW